MQDVSSKTGEGIYRRAAMSLNEITFNGNDGIFFERDKDAKKDEKTNKYPKTQITQEGESISVVFLKIRRVLASFSKKASMRTNEHNHKNETVTLYKADGKEFGLAKDLRDKYPQLKTQQVVYCWIPGDKNLTDGRIVRLVVKGSSLGSDYKHGTEVLKFYDYLQSFANNEHSHEFITELKPVKEEGPQGDYYAISFVKGRKLDESESEFVATTIDDIHERITAIDERLKSNFGKPMDAAVPADATVDEDVEDIPTIQQGDDTGSDIDVDSIPF